MDLTGVICKQKPKRSEGAGTKDKWRMNVSGRGKAGSSGAGLASIRATGRGAYS